MNDLLRSRHSSGASRLARCARCASPLLILVVVGCKERMRDQPSLMPNEQPLLSVPAGSVPVEGGEPALTPAEAAGLANPVPNTAEELATGRTGYARYCSHCHGDLGRGRTIVGASLDPAPADLVPALAGKSDGELFGVITFGGKTSPALGSAIDVRDRWRIVRFLRTLPGAANPARPAWGQ